MKMIVSGQMQKMLQEQLVKPVGPTEIRRAVGMGELYITQVGFVPTEDGYVFKKQYTLMINDVLYQFHARYVDVSDDF